MTIKEREIDFDKFFKKIEKTKRSKEALKCLDRSSKIYSKTKTNCIKCNGLGYLRVSLDEAKTCLNCYGKGFLIKEIHKF